MRAVVEAVIRICETRWEGLSAEYAARRTLLALTRPSLTSSLRIAWTLSSQYARKVRPPDAGKGNLGHNLGTN